MCVIGSWRLSLGICMCDSFPNVTVWSFWLDLITGETCEETWKVYGSLYVGDGSCGWLNMTIHVSDGSGACVRAVGGVCVCMEVYMTCRHLVWSLH